MHQGAYVRNHARFTALRRRVFGEMAQAGVRWRLAWLVPYNLLVITLLVIRGESRDRALLQLTSLAISSTSFVAMAFRRRSAERHDYVPFWIGSLCFFIGVGTTGGAASPLIAGGFPMLVAASLVIESRRTKLAYFSLFFAGLTLVSLLSATSVAPLVAPLAPTAGRVSPEYVFLALGSTLFAGLVVLRMGQAITTAYQRVALELAERREEICTETEDRTRALEAIAARLAHEVKNPLAAIKGLSAHMARSATDPKTAERLSIVAAEADRLQAIVEGFLSFSRGLDDLKVAPVKPHEIARELALLLETRAAEGGVRIEVTGDDAMVVHADGRKLRQALLNLVLNAMQASYSGGLITVEVAKACGDRARIRVIDRGTGMTPDVLERIRKPYFTTREGGTGLGVAVARGLIEQHGGQIHYESVAGRGTTVSIELPVNSAGHGCPMSLPNPLRHAAKVATPDV